MLNQTDNLTYCFESYGVPVLIGSNSADMLEQAVRTARSALLEQIREVPAPVDAQSFELDLNQNGQCSIIQNGQNMVTGVPEAKFWKYFDSLVRILVAEYAPSVVFIHAGVVGWKGKALVFPGDSFFGKTTLVAELVRRGAEYYSDEYAVIDEDGLIHPFARPLSLRSNGGGTVTETNVTFHDLGGVAADVPKPVGCVLFTKFEAGSEWEPEFLTLGQGIMKIMLQTIAIRRNTEFAINLLKKALTNAIIVESPRSDSAEFAEVFLEFVDNKAF
jgi:hypothetical protein